MNGRYSSFAKATSRVCGHPGVFVLAVVVILMWIITGPLFDFSDTWQLVINTATTIITFLMVFLIQSTQNRDTEAIQVKLDELIRATKGAHNILLDLEDMDDEQLEEMRLHYQMLAKLAREAIKSGKLDTDTPEFEKLKEEIAVEAVVNDGDQPEK
jgi:low affinity Fe/Cu permease